MSALSWRLWFMVAAAPRTSIGCPVLFHRCSAHDIRGQQPQREVETAPAGERHGLVGDLAPKFLGVVAGPLAKRSCGPTGDTLHGVRDRLRIGLQRGPVAQRSVHEAGVTPGSE